MICRKNIKDLTPSEKSAFVQALIDLKNAPSQISDAQSAGGQGRYDDYVWIHNQVRGAAHNAPAFLPWHREFLYQFERDLQTASGNPNIRLPYWDWTKARSASDPGWPFTNDFMGSLGASASDSRVTGGRFATDAADPAATEWRLNITDAETGNYLKRRGAGVEFALPTLSTARQSMNIATFDVAPWVVPDTFTDAQFNAALLASFRKFLEFALHNGPHPWVGTLGQFNDAGTVITNADLVGSMSWQASPNDPVFWLHHCNVDRLWANWQQRYDYPGYLPQSGGPPFQDGDDVMGMFSDASYFNFPQHATPNSNENHKTQGYIYFSDLPEVSAPTSPSLSFGDVPEGLLTYKPVQFPVTSCQPVKFRITAVGGAGFSDPYPGAHTVNPPAGSETFTADAYVAYQAPPGGSGPAAGSVTIEAFINDPDRLYVPTTAPNDEVIVGSWTVSLSANVVSRPQAAIALALDRSGSMSLQAGGGLRRFDLLEGALQVVADLMRSTDALGLVYYDHNVIRRMNITAMTAAGGQAQVTAAINDPALEPSGGNTAIGSGMIEAADVLNDEISAAGTPYSRFAMLVMTDGNENVTPYANDPAVTSAIASFSSHVYAVGLGREGEVSEATLGAIANYMLITGDMNADEREFRLTKYFVQILAGITNLAIVTDPVGHLTFGAEHRIEFDLTEADLEADVIALSPLAFLIDMKLEAPDGTVLTPSAPGPNGSFQRNLKDAFYRLKLPVEPGRPDGTHGGRWTAILSLARDRIKELSSKLEEFPDLIERLRGGVVPYTLVVHSYSNVSLAVRVEQSDLKPGAKLQLSAELSQYKAPLGYRGSVRVEITAPGGSLSHVQLAEQGPGEFLGEFQTTVPGVYQCRFLAKGTTLEGEKFTREETRTAAVYRREPTPATPTDGNDHDDDRLVCEFIACLLADPGIQKLLKRHEIDAERLRACLKKACSRRSSLTLRERLDIVKDEVTAQIPSARAAEELKRRMEPLLRESGPLGILETPAPQELPVPKVAPTPMNPLGGMWPTARTKNGEHVLLLKTEKGRLVPPPEQWDVAEEPEPEPRMPKLAPALAKRFARPAKKARKAKKK